MANPMRKSLTNNIENDQLTKLLRIINTGTYNKHWQAATIKSTTHLKTQLDKHNGLFLQYFFFARATAAGFTFERLRGIAGSTAYN